jgi:ABC-type phosphate/phosphonate transport system substrate-binding protein
MRRLRNILVPLAVAAIAAAAWAEAPGQPAAMPKTLRIAYAATTTSPCAAPGAQTPAPAAALAKHLAARLNLSVQLCAFADPGAAAAALADGGVDFASLTPAAWAGARGKGRPILTLRAEGRLPRTPILAVARRSTGRLTAAGIARRNVILVRHDPLARDAARAAVISHGGAMLAQKTLPVAGSFPAAIAALASGKADVALVPVDLWQNGCIDTKGLCAPYEVVWQDRPLADSAWVLRSGLADELRYRLIGIFLALHLENRAAFAGAAAGARGEFEPTEATALDAAPAQ